jgi:hypothetical protein
MAAMGRSAAPFSSAMTIASTGQFCAASTMSSSDAASGFRTTAVSSSSRANTAGRVSTQSPKP